MRWYAAAGAGAALIVALLAALSLVAMDPVPPDPCRGRTPGVSPS